MPSYSTPGLEQYRSERQNRQQARRKNMLGMMYARRALRLAENPSSRNSAEGALNQAAHYSYGSSADAWDAQAAYLGRDPYAEVQRGAPASGGQAGQGQAPSPEEDEMEAAKRREQEVIRNTLADQKARDLGLRGLPPGAEETGQGNPAPQGGSGSTTASSPTKPQLLAARPQRNALGSLPLLTPELEAGNRAVTDALAEGEGERAALRYQKEKARLQRDLDVNNKSWYRPSPAAPDENGTVSQNTNWGTASANYLTPEQAAERQRRKYRGTINGRPTEEVLPKVEPFVRPGAVTGSWQIPTRRS